MIKNILRVGILVVAGALVACNPLTQFTLSEQELDSYLQKNVQYSKKIDLLGIGDANIVITDLKTQIGRSEPNKVTLSGKAQVDVGTLLGNVSAVLTLTLKAQPTYDQQTGSIYLKEIELTDYQVSPKNGQTIVSTVIPYLASSLKAYFNLLPVYVIDAEKSKTEALVKKSAKRIEVKPGELVIPLTD